jgi:hypothetical protein
VRPWYPNPHRTRGKQEAFLLAGAAIFATRRQADEPEAKHTVELGPNVLAFWLAFVLFAPRRVDFTYLNPSIML